MHKSKKSISIALLFLLMIAFSALLLSNEAVTVPLNDQDEKTANLSKAKNQSADAFKQKADSCLIADDFDCAIAYLKKLMNMDSREMDRANIQWQIAGVYSFFKKDYMAAAREYRVFIDEYPKDPRVHEANFIIGKIFFDLRDPKESSKYLRAVPVSSDYFEESQTLLNWLEDNWKYEAYYNAKKIMIGISILEILFVICWILLGNIHQLKELLKRRSFVLLFLLVLVFLAVKLYFNFMLYNLLQGISG